MAAPIFKGLLVARLCASVLRRNWFRLWLRLELNIVVFIPLFRADIEAYQIENRIKYFLVQRVGSVWFFMSAVLVLGFGVGAASLAGIAAIALKLGLAPFHI